MKTELTVRKPQLIQQPSQQPLQEHDPQPLLDSCSHQQTFRHFTYNDSDPFRQSTNQLWADVYQYPSDLGFFTKSKARDRDTTQFNTVPSAREAWNIYDPWNQSSQEPSVFRQQKERLFHQQQVSKDESLARDTQKGWNELFAQPFWGSSYEKPPPFMGAFDHVQPDFGNSLNVSIPSAAEYKPYSCYLQASSIALKNPYQSDVIHEDSNLLNSKLLYSKQDKDNDKRGKDKLYYFEIESVESRQKDDIEIEDFKESRIEHKQQPMDRSVAWSYEVLFAERQAFRCANPTWEAEYIKVEQGSQAIDGIQNSQLFQIHKDTNSKLICSLQSQMNLESDIATVLPESFILSELSKMLQNVQCELFTLDYSTLTWKLDLLSFRPELFLRNSLGHVIEKLLQTASYRSRLSCVLSFLRKSKYRKVYSELSVQIQQFLVIFEQIIISLAKECSLTEYLQHTDKLACEVQLLYNLIINSQYIQEEAKSYEDVDFRFLHSEALIFKRILKLARNSDAIELETNPLVFKLTEAAFKPLLVLLDRILFEECQYLELNTDLYLRYYFPNPKEIVQMVSKKVALIKQESNELYLICKVKEQLALLNTIESLSGYEKKWERSFNRKRKLIERIRRQYKQKMRWQRQRRKEQKMKEIYQLKQKIYQSQQQQFNKKLELQTKNRQDLERLKITLEEKRQKRRLMEQIQKEREKNILLDLQLKEKQRLAREKEKLIKKIEKGISEDNKIQQEGEQEKVEANQQMKVQSQLSIQSHQVDSVDQHQRDDEKQKMDKAHLSQVLLPQHPVSQIIEPKPQENIQSVSKVPSLLSEGHQVASQNLIKSNEALQPRFIETADAFMSLAHKKNNPKSRNSSYFRIIQKPASGKLLQESASDEQLEIMQPEPSSEQSESSQQMEVEEEESLLRQRKVDVQTCLSVCVDEVVRKQSQIVQNCLRFIIIDKYQIMGIIEFLRAVLMSGNGEKLQQFIKLSISPDSLLALRHFNKCLLFDTPLQFIQILSPGFYHTKNDIRHTCINIFEDNLEYYIGFEFKSLPSILQPYFSYIHLSKYMQIFAFVVRLRHCQNLVSQSWKMLNGYHREVQKKKRQGELVEHQLRFMNYLCMVRYKISNFLKTFQNYFFFRVIEKEYKTFRSHLNELTALEDNHLKLLDNIIRYGFIDNPNHQISKIFKQILAQINHFYLIVNRLITDDIASYAWPEVEEKVKFIHGTFDQELRNIQALLFKLN